MDIHHVAEQFIAWAKRKIRIHISILEKRVYFHERQVWWVALGKNVGPETDGKDTQFHRPVLVLKKYNEHMCFVVPLTTQIKSPSVWYQIPISFDLKPSVVNISQGRTISSKRFLRKIAVLNVDDFDTVVLECTKQFSIPTGSGRDSP